MQNTYNESDSVSKSLKLQFDSLSDEFFMDAIQRQAINCPKLAYRKKTGEIKH